MTVENPLKALAEKTGIAPEWKDIWGKTHPVPDESLKTLLAAMGYVEESDDGWWNAARRFDEASASRLLPPVCVIRQKAQPFRIRLNVPEEWHDARLAWTLRRESGQETHGEINLAELENTGVVQVGDRHIHRFEWSLPAEVPIGYHELHVGQTGQGHRTSMRLVVAPERCYLPSAIERGHRIWGPSLQLYALRSHRNWGIGDFTDLANMVDWSADLGGGIIGVSPLHYLFPENPAHSSPYSPSSRYFLNVLFLDVEAVPDFHESEKARTLVLSPDFQARLGTLRQDALVDYPAVMAMKWPVLEMLYQAFRQNHLVQQTDRARDFYGFLQYGGDQLQKLALFQALQERFQKEDPLMWGWPAWPEAYQDPGSDAVREFAEANEERVQFYLYLQWEADRQLSLAGRRAYERRLPVGLFMDVAVGVDRAGAEVWANRSLYVTDVSVGSPPDDFSPQGQNWGLPAVNPRRLYEDGYRMFSGLLARNMRHAGAIRLDHIMRLMRLFWIPNDALPESGTYVHYRLHDLMGVLALESHRNRCMVVGEDLGTVPDAVRNAMKDWGIFSSRVFFFEKNDEGEYQPPQAYPADAAVAVSTHDLPTLSGFWQSQDINLRTELDLYPDPALQKEQIRTRLMERMGILSALEREGIDYEGKSTDPAAFPYITPDLCGAVHRYLARTPSRLLLVRLEDALDQLEPVNVPGTTSEYPNWRRRLPVAIEDLVHDDRLLQLAGILREERKPVYEEEPREEEIPRRLGADVPRATYRFQFNKDFTFRQAEGLVDYLDRLGVSHCYASPLLASRSGSTHGYDIINHKLLDPEIGTREAFDSFSDRLRERKMGLLVDIVPNHMGVGSDNPWWMDVLENGPASAYSDYFDIDWLSIKKELQGKVLLPVLGDHYGRILENDELHLHFDAKLGLLTLRYYDHVFPINPRSYPMVLGHRLEVLEARLGNTAPAFYEYQSIMTAFERLPVHTEDSLDLQEERIREKAIARNRLSTLCMNVPDVAEFIGENLRDFGCEPGDPTNAHRLHRLLEAQAYRLAYWRVAMDEINYRRFFDINDLAGLRMEDPRVFADTHEMILDFIENGQVTGLRIDHPDGLFDPTDYFRRLQEETRVRLGLETIEPLEDLKVEDELPLYILVEKILAPFERLPDAWMVHGTTGYDFANEVGGLFVDQENERSMNRIYQRFANRPASRQDFEDLVYQCKLLTMETSLASELSVLAYQLNRISETDLSARDYTLHNLRSALMEVVASFPVYRTYISQDGVSRKDCEYIDWAISAAKKRSKAIDTSIFDFIRKVLLQELEEGRPEDTLRFTMRFQQYTGPVMAKSLEDTAFYRYNRLVSLNEVGGEPGHFGTSVSAFHYQNTERRKNAPDTMLCTSTHDTKRSEDVRSRISVLSEIPDVWQQQVSRWSRLNRSKVTELDGLRAPTKNDEYLFYQILVGVWPLEPADPANHPDVLKEMADRVEAYMLKACREGKEHTSWLNPNTDYEEAVSRFVQEALCASTTNPFLEEFQDFHQDVAMPGMLNSLSQTLLKLTSPGMPDIYQGNEVWNFSLVDPDNRRPVDYDRLNEMARRLEPLLADSPWEEKRNGIEELVSTMRGGDIKMYVTMKTLQYRRRCPELFADGDYIPLEVQGEQAAHVVAFARRLEDQAVITVAPRLVYWLTTRESPFPADVRAWEGTEIILPEEIKTGPITNMMTGEVLHLQGDRIRVGQILGSFPVALLSVESHSAL